MSRDEQWTEIAIPRDCTSILIGESRNAIQFWGEVKKRAPVILHEPTDALPVIIGYVPDSEDHRVWETLDPPTLAKRTQ